LARGERDPTVVRDRREVARLKKQVQQLKDKLPPELVERLRKTHAALEPGIHAALAKLEPTLEKEKELQALEARIGTTLARSARGERDPTVVRGRREVARLKKQIQQLRDKLGPELIERLRKTHAALEPKIHTALAKLGPTLEKEKELQALEARISATLMRAARGERDPTVVRDRREVARLKKQIQQLKNKLGPEMVERLSIQASLAIEEAKIASLEGKIALLRKEIARLKKQIQQLEDKLGPERIERLRKSAAEHPGQAGD
jgi:chromosome segregation ATPase